MELPLHCWAKFDGNIVHIHRGTKGYTPCPALDKIEADVDHYNNTLSVTKAQAAAMLAGSMFGWDVPGANPDNYDEDGKLKQ